MRIVSSSLRFRDQPHEPQLRHSPVCCVKRRKCAADQESSWPWKTTLISRHARYCNSSKTSHQRTSESISIPVTHLRLFEDPVEEAKLLAPYIHATHIKDLSPRRGGSPEEWNFWESVPAGQGVVDIQGVMRVLQAQGYPGVLCVEVDCLRESWEEDDAVVAEPGLPQDRQR